MLSSPEFWVAVGFILLVAGAARPAWRAITKGLDARAERIKSTLDEAAKLREEAQHLLAEYQRKQRDAMKETEEIVAHAKAEAERLSAKALADLDVAIKRREQLAIEKIAQAEADALREVREISVDLAVAAARTLIADHLDDKSKGDLVDEAIKDLPDKLH